MAFNFSQSLETLNIMLGDTENVTFTPEEKQRALTEAWNDKLIYVPIWDTSLTFSASTFFYDKPSNVDVVQDLYYVHSGSQNSPQPISSDCWEILNGKIHLTRAAQNFYSDGDAIYVKGKTKLGVSDTIPDDNTNLQEYLLNLAAYNTLKLLTYKKANLFLKNDTTMAELVALRREMKAEVEEYRRRLPREWERA